MRSPDVPATVQANKNGSGGHAGPAPAHHAAAHHPGGQPAQTDFRWFPVTAAGLAHLKVSVPAGFRQVQPPPTR